jgi:hypothetical protein
MRDRGVAREELPAVLPPALAEQIDWSTLEPDDTGLVDGDGFRHADLVLRCCLRNGHDVVVSILLEHQSAMDRWMPLRLLGYGTRHLERLAQNDPERRTLPLLVAVVVHQGERPWTGPRSMDDLYAAEPALDTAVGALTPRLTFAVDDLAGRSEADIQSRLSSPFAKLAVSVMRAVRIDDDPLAVLDRAGPLLRAVRDGPDGAGAFADVIRYVSEVRDTGLDQVRARVTAIDRGLGGEVMTLAERLRDEGRAEGRGQLLLKLLTLKFGIVGPEVASRVQTADAATIDRWAERVLVAQTLDDVLS